MKNESIISHTDFKTWDRNTLEQFARQSADENVALKADLKTALTAWREAVKSKEIAS